MLLPTLEHLNPAPAGIDTQCHGTSLSQLWREDGLSSGVEMLLVTPLPPLCVCNVALWSLFV